MCHITGTYDFGDGQGEVPIGHVITIADPAYQSHIDHGDPPAHIELTLPDGSQVCTAGGETPDTEKIVFLTSAIYAGTSLGGLDGADAICQGLADAAGLVGTYKAWLSTDGAGNSPASGRFTQSTVPYVLADGTVIADNWEGLTDGYLDARINVDESGTLMDGPFWAWTATKADGTPTEGNLDCNDWGTGYAYGMVGASYYSGPEWSDYYDGTVCHDTAHLYCFQQ